MSQRILVFTKDRSLAALLESGLEKRGFAVSIANNRQRVVAWTTAGKADFVLVDASTAPEQGLKLCQEVRRCDRSARVIIALPSRRGWNLHDTDAWMLTPVTLRKVRSHLRRLSAAAARDVLQVGDVQLDPRNKVVRRGDCEAHLTPKETLLLQLLMQQAGRIVSRKEIMKIAWDTDYTGDTRTIDVHIRWLRKKIEPAPGKPIYIRTMRRRGYRFEAPGLDLLPQPQPQAAESGVPVP